MISALVWAVLSLASIGYEIADNAALETKLGSGHISESRSIAHVAGDVCSHKIKQAASVVALIRYNQPIVHGNQQANRNRHVSLPRVKTEQLANRFYRLFADWQVVFLNCNFARENAKPHDCRHIGKMLGKSGQARRFFKRNEFGPDPSAFGQSSASVLHSESDSQSTFLLFSIPSKRGDDFDSLNFNPSALISDENFSGKLISFDGGFRSISVQFKSASNQPDSPDADAYAKQSGESCDPLCVRIRRRSVGFPEAGRLDWLFIPAGCLLVVLLSVLAVGWITKPGNSPNENQKGNAKTRN
ncbi:hypothetical protein [Mesorhizobium loti]|uniref:hypothetical protein n=1 Tax=Rhizobium loti TaxID=381 RepID=UPI001268F27A|nr:hypothetical protein [Mesorhizobium loti]